jgi:hypothetical protein
LAAAATLSILSVVPASAAPSMMVGRSAITSPNTAIELVHGRHRACLLGPAGWHFHGPYGARFACGPQRRPWRRY